MQRMSQSHLTGVHHTHNRFNGEHNDSESDEETSPLNRSGAEEDQPLTDETDDAEAGGLEATPFAGVFTDWLVTIPLFTRIFCRILIVCSLLSFLLTFVLDVKIIDLQCSPEDGIFNFSLPRIFLRSIVTPWLSDGFYSSIVSLIVLYEVSWRLETRKGSVFYAVIFIASMLTVGLLNYSLMRVSFTRNMAHSAPWVIEYWCNSVGIWPTLAALLVFENRINWETPRNFPCIQYDLPNIVIPFLFVLLQQFIFPFNPAVVLGLLFAYIIYLPVLACLPHWSGVLERAVFSRYLHTKYYIPISKAGRIQPWENLPLSNT